jgi:hypothetical protein
MQRENGGGPLLCTRCICRDVKGTISIIVDHHEITKEDNMDRNKSFEIWTQSVSLIDQLCGTSVIQSPITSRNINDEDLVYYDSLTRQKWDKQKALSCPS